MNIITQKGRSMVEMLGVLAIVGVLSVGAIAGYSKAMMKYKLNKHAESFNQLLNNIIRVQPQLEKDILAKHGSSFDVEILSELNLIPDGMTVDLSRKRIVDIFKNDMTYYLGYHNNGTGTSALAHLFYISLSSNGSKITRETSEICHNILNVAKENAANISSIQIRAGQESSYSSYIMYGDKSKNQDPNKNLRKMTLDDVDEFCYACTSDVYCQFYFYINSISGFAEVAN